MMVTIQERRGRVRVRAKYRRLEEAYRALGVLVSTQLDGHRFAGSYLDPPPMGQGATCRLSVTWEIPPNGKFLEVDQYQSLAGFVEELGIQEVG